MTPPPLPRPSSNGYHEKEVFKDEKKELRNLTNDQTLRKEEHSGSRLVVFANKKMHSVKRRCPWFLLEF